MTPLYLGWQIVYTAQLFNAASKVIMEYMFRLCFGIRYSKDEVSNIISNVSCKFDSSVFH